MTFISCRCRLLLWKCGGEFGVGNVGKDVGNVMFDKVIRREMGGREVKGAGKSELGKTGVVILGGRGLWELQCWLKAPYILSFYRVLSALMMSTDVSNVGIAIFPSF